MKLPSWQALLLVLCVLTLSGCQSSGQGGLDNREAIQVPGSPPQDSGSVIRSAENVDKGQPRAERRNSFFFPPGTSQLSYQGQSWSEEWDGDKKVNASLQIEKLVELGRGELYRLSFTIDQLEKPEKRTLYLWVAEQEIYELAVKVEEAQQMQKTGQSPEISPGDLRFKQADWELEQPPWHSSIEDDGQTCKYQTVHNSGHFSTWVWAKGQGLVQYARGYGAHRAGWDLRRAE